MIVELVTSGTIIFGTGPRINVLERSELVSTEMEILIATLEKIRKKAAKQHALLKAQLEEIGVRVVEVDKASGMFNQSVIIEGNFLFTSFCCLGVLFSWPSFEDK